MCAFVPAVVAGAGDADCASAYDSRPFVELQPLPFSVDIWTDTGGQGLSISGGAYGPEDDVTVYVSATWDCIASIGVGLLNGELYAMMDVNLIAGETLQLPPIPLWDIDEPEGTWIVTVDAISGDVVASDNVRFTVARGAGSSAPFTIDIMTDRGGRGAGVPGGMYSLGTKTIITIELSQEADVALSIEGPGISDSDTARLLPGPHTIDLGVAEEGDEGVWIIDVVASDGGRQASDHVQFSVLPDDIWGGVAVTPSSASEFDALVALKMAMGQLDEDPIFDVDRDGTITADDAGLILLWAVSR